MAATGKRAPVVRRLQDRHLLPLGFTNLLRAKPVKMVLI
jgi:hypothetical protein